jgi:hypothetical protein
MATMGIYCRAYPITRLQEFPGWSEKPVPPRPPDPDDEASTDAALDERYLFLQENLVVTDGIFMDEAIVFDTITPEWRAFCEGTLEFRIPDDVQAASGDMDMIDTTMAQGEQA